MKIVVRPGETLVASSLENLAAALPHVEAEGDVPCYVTPIAPKNRVHVLSAIALSDLHCEEEEKRRESPHLFRSPKGSE